jgi:hypothetical protein
MARTINAVERSAREKVKDAKIAQLQEHLIEAGKLVGELKKETALLKREIKQLTE